MGYRSEVVIAIHKKIMARNLISGELPKLLKDQPHYQVDDAFYWKFENIKWYSNYPEVQEVEAYFEALEASADDPENDDDDVINMSFGAIRVGENPDDIESWGEPDDFDITANTHIDCPSQ